MAPVSAKRARTLPEWAILLFLAASVIFYYWIPMTSRSASIQWDAADMHYPLQKYFSEHLLSGSLPHWTPYLFSGYPFLSNTEVGAWYLPHWPFFVAGITPRSIQLELVVAAFIACLGTYLFVTLLVADRVPAVIGAFAYGFSGFFAGHSSHVGLFCAAAWFPWLLWAYRRAMDSAAVRHTALGGLAGGLMILAGYPQTAAYGFLGLGLYVLSDLGFDRRRWIRGTTIMLSILVGALLVAAIQVLPGLELTSHSIRAGANYSLSAEGVLQVQPLMTLFAPDWLGIISGRYTGPVDRTQYYFYSGLLLLPLGVVGVLKTKMRVAGLVIILPALWYMAGPAGGFYNLGRIVPGLYKFRAPIQGWFVVALGLALLAAAGANWIFRRWPASALRIALTAILFIDVWYWNIIRNPLAYAQSSFADLYGAREEATNRHVAATQAPLTRFHAPRYLAAMGPLDHPLDLNLETTYGYFALEPAAYDEYIAVLDGGNLRLLDGLNVSRVLDVKAGALKTNSTMLPRTYFPKSVSSVGSPAESRQSLRTLDPAAGSVVLSPHGPIQQDPAATATVVSHDEQSYQVRYHAASSSLLKLSEAWFPGWHAELSGKELPVLRVDHALMGVIVPAGAGEVTWRFRTDYFAVGMLITLISGLGLIIVAYISGVRGTPKVPRGGGPRISVCGSQR